MEESKFVQEEKNIEEKKEDQLTPEEVHTGDLKESLQDRKYSAQSARALDNDKMDTGKMLIKGSNQEHEADKINNRAEKPVEVINFKEDMGFGNVNPATVNSIFSAYDDSILMSDDYISENKKMKNKKNKQRHIGAEQEDNQQSIPNLEINTAPKVANLDKSVQTDDLPVQEYRNPDQSSIVRTRNLLLSQRNYESPELSPANFETHKPELLLNGYARTTKNKTATRFYKSQTSRNYVADITNSSESAKRIPAHTSRKSTFYGSESKHKVEPIRIEDLQRDVLSSMRLRLDSDQRESSVGDDARSGFDTPQSGDDYVKLTPKPGMHHNEVKSIGSIVIEKLEDPVGQLTEEEENLRLMYKTMAAKARQDPKLLTFLKNYARERGEDVDKEGGFVATFDLFVDYINNMRKMHQKCGDNCHHLQRFYARIGYYNIWNKREPLLMKKSAIVSGKSTSKAKGHMKLPSISDKKILKMAS